MQTIDNDETSSVIAPPKLLARDWIAGLERGIAVIEAFDEEHPRLTASQVGERCGLARTAAAVSVPLPGPKGTTNLMVLDGKACAWAAGAMAAPRATRPAATRARSVLLRCNGMGDVSWQCAFGTL